MSHQVENCVRSLQAALNHRVVRGAKSIGLGKLWPTTARAGGRFAMGSLEMSEPNRKTG